MMVGLADLSLGESARVVACRQSGSLAPRLASLGLIPGTVFTVKRFAPMGDPVEIHFRGFRLALRAHEAQGLEVERL